MFKTETSNHPPMSMRQLYDIFIENGGSIDGFTRIVTERTNSIVFATAKKVGENAVGFPTELFNLLSKGKPSQVIEVLRAKASQTDRLLSFRIFSHESIPYIVPVGDIERYRSSAIAGVKQGDFVISNGSKYTPSAETRLSEYPEGARWLVSHMPDKPNRFAIEDTVEHRELFLAPPSTKIQPTPDPQAVPA